MVTDSMRGMYGQEAAALSKGSALLGQVGGGMPSVPAPPPPAPAQEPAGSPGGGPAPEQEPAPQDPGVAPQGGVESATIHLKGGQTVTGRPLEHTKELLKILCEGVELTYYTDEIESVELRSP
jgi:hypothetical protein